MHRSNSLILDAQNKNKLEDIDRTADRRQYAWAGHVSRMLQYDPDRLTVRILHHRNKPCLHQMKRTHGNQTHCRNLKIWRWERATYEYFKDRCICNWEEVAQDKIGWNNILDELVAWRAEVR